LIQTSQSGPALQRDFEAVVHEHQALVFRTLLRLTGDRDRVEDLAQEVFLRLYRGLGLFTGAARLSTYLYRIILNVAQDEWKRRRRERAHLATPAWKPDLDPDAPAWIETMPAREPNPEQQVANRQTIEAVDRALLHLPPAERAVLVLYHQEECSYEQIAHTLGVPINTVRTHLHRGRQRLSELLRAAPASKIEERKPCIPAAKTLKPATHR
jgi:RNA polymerase sigma-70 factor (ECF subfamily)